MLKRSIDVKKKNIYKLKINCYISALLINLKFLKMKKIMFIFLMLFSIGAFASGSESDSGEKEKSEISQDVGFHVVNATALITKKLLNHINDENVINSLNNKASYLTITHAKIKLKEKRIIIKNLHKQLFLKKRYKTPYKNIGFVGWSILETEKN